MGEPVEAIVKSIDELDNNKLEEALSDFLVEQKLIGEFLVWIEKWKALHLIG